MLMKQISLVICGLLLVVCGVHAQTPVPSESVPWKTYTIKGGHFSVAFPTYPAMHTSSSYNARARKNAKIRQLGAYADGVVYTIYIIDNPEPRHSLDEFVEKRMSRIWDRTTARDINVDGVAGKAVASVDRTSGTAQFFAAEGNLYEFVALGMPEDDPRVKKFLASIALKKKKGSEEVSDGHGFDYEPTNQSGANNLAADQKPVTGKEVDKKARLGMKPEPSYTNQRDSIRSLGLSCSGACSRQTEVSIIFASFQLSRMDSQRTPLMRRERSSSSRR